MRYEPVGHNYWEERTAIVESKKEDQPDVPVVSEELLTIKWIDSFTDHLRRCIGICYVLSVCVVCKRWMSTLFCHIVSRTKLTALSMDLSWMNGLFRQDNAAVYYKIEEAVRGTNYADSIKPFQARKDGRGAFLALVSQYAGKDKWEAEIKKAVNLLTTLKWKGSQNLPFGKA